MNKLLKYSLFLAVLCAISGLLLSFVNSLTAPIIEDRKREERWAALKKHFNYFDYRRVDDESNDTESNVIQGYFYAFNENKELEAVIYRTSFQGYKSQIICLISIKADGTIENVKVIDRGEDNDVTKHNFGVTGEPVDDYNFVPKTGSTETSNTVHESVEAAVSHFKTIRDSLGGVRYE